MRVLLDTNVIISGILFGGFARELLGKALRGEIALVTSPVLVDELEDLLAAKFSFSPAAARETRRELEALGDVVEPTEIPDVCRDAWCFACTGRSRSSARRISCTAYGAVDRSQR